MLHTYPLIQTGGVDATGRSRHEFSVSSFNFNSCGLAEAKLFRIMSIELYTPRYNETLGLEHAQLTTEFLKPCLFSNKTSQSRSALLEARNQYPLT